MRLSGVRNEPSSAVRSGPPVSSTAFGMQPAPAPPRPDLDDLIGDRLRRPRPRPGRSSRLVFLSRIAITGSGAPPRLFDEQDVLDADRLRRDPRRDELIAGRQVTDRGPAVRPGRRRPGSGEARRGCRAVRRRRSYRTRGAIRAPAIGRPSGPSTRIGPRLRLAERRTDRAAGRRGRRDRQPGPIGQEVDAVDDPPAQRRDLQPEPALGVGRGLGLGRVLLAPATLGGA